MKKNFKYAVFFIVCVAVFSGSSFLYLHLSKTAKETQEQPSAVPYATTPVAAELRLSLPLETITVYLDFENGEVCVYTNQNGFLFADENNRFNIVCDEPLIAGVIDRIGGIELQADGVCMHYTGIQVTQLLYGEKGTQELRRQALAAFFEKVAEVGLTRKDFVYIIENTKTDLTVPDCFYWPEYTAEICGRCTIY